jgi:hypothetical protein
MTLDLEVEIQVEGSVTPGQTGTWNQPPEGPEVQLDHVWLVKDEPSKGLNSIDILGFLSQAEVDIIEEAMLEEAADLEPEPYYDTVEERDM